MLSGAISLSIPGVKSAMDKIDAFKSRFLAVPANVRMALDTLARVRMLVTRTAPETVAFHTAAINVQNNLESTQRQWSLAAERFSELDKLRQQQSSVSLDTVLLASQLLSSVSSVLSRSDVNIRAVDDLAKQYLTPEQRAQVQMQTVGTPASTEMGIGTVAMIGIAAFLFLRRR